MTFISGFVLYDLLGRWSDWKSSVICKVFIYGRHIASEGTCSVLSVLNRKDLYRATPVVEQASVFLSRYKDHLLRQARAGELLSKAGSHWDVF